MKHIKLFENFNINEFKDEPIDFSDEYSNIDVVFPDGEIHKIKTIGQIWMDENTYGFAIGIKPKDVPFIKTNEKVITLYETNKEDPKSYVEDEMDFADVLSELNFEEVIGKITKIKWTKELLELHEINLDEILKAQKK